MWTECCVHGNGPFGGSGTSTGVVRRPRDSSFGAFLSGELSLVSLRWECQWGDGESWGSDTVAVVSHLHGHSPGLVERVPRDCRRRGQVSHTVMSGLTCEGLLVPRFKAASPWVTVRVQQGKTFWKMPEDHTGVHVCVRGYGHVGAPQTPRGYSVGGEN